MMQKNRIPTQTGKADGANFNISALLKWGGVGVALVVAVVLFMTLYHSTDARATYADNVLTVNGITYRMIPVEGDRFQMGAHQNQSNHMGVNEKPVHWVTVDNYLIGETEVTQDLWHAVMGKNPSEQKGHDLPVESVSWEDCETFIGKLNALTGMKFRFPTEAEWEFAARGGKKSKGYAYSGSDNIDDVAWYYQMRRTQERSVKRKKPNELGLYDMSGNVFEWCQDWYGDYTSESQTNPQGPSSGTFHVYRGGSWSTHSWRCRTSYRSANVTEFDYHFMGLRLALSE